MKKYLITLFIIFSCSFIFAEKYQITDIKYDISGKTREYVLSNKVEINKKHIFKDEEELVNYVKDTTQRLENTRNFEEYEADFEVGDADENGICPVTLLIKTKDSKHLLVLPYPKYDSNSGFLLKLKAKDTNFMGTMEEMSADFNFEIEQDKDPWEYTTGLSIGFNIPFKWGKAKSTWTNDHSFSYTFGKKTPEWNLKTGLKTEIPFDRFSLNFDFYQSFVRDLDYEDADVNGKKVHYGDGTYFIEDGTVSIPIVIQEIENWGKLYYTPYFQVIYDWDFDGISGDNRDLQSPVLTVGQKVSTSRINWYGNFRKGFEIKIDQSYSYNIYRREFSPGIDCELKAYNSNKWAGICFDMYAFAYLHSNKKIGSRLRGIRDEQYFSKDSGYAEKKACETPAGVVLSVDIPIHLFTTDWSKVPLIKHIPLFTKYLNFEMQISPFVDIALFHNRATGTSMNYKDGFYSGGLEVLVFPTKWKGIQIRGSIGVDLGRIVPGFKGKLNQDWRDSVSKYEIMIGLGLQY